MAKDANVVTKGAGDRLRAAKLRNSFFASLLTRKACENLQQEFERIALALGETAPPVLKYVRYMNLYAEEKFQEYLAADREIRHTKNVLACLAEERDGAATEVAAVLAPAKRASDEVLPPDTLKPWLHGPVARTPAALHLQADDVSFWLHEARDDFGQPVLEGLRFAPDELAAEIDRRTEKLGGVLGSHDEVAGRLDVVRFRARKAGEACDQCYLQVKATLEAVFGLGGASAVVKKYGPPSLRKLQRSRKRKRKGVVAEQVAEAVVTESDSPAVNPVLGLEESDLQAATRAPAAEESDLQTATRAPRVGESDLQTATRAPRAEESDLHDATHAPRVRESDLQTGTCSPAACRDSSALTDVSRGKRRREFAVTSGGGGHGGRLSAVTNGVRGPRRWRLSVTKGVCGPRRSGSEVTDTVRSPENRGGAFQEGVTARIRRFFARG